MAHVLVVDDDDEIRRTLRLAFEDEGHMVTDAATGADALAILRAGSEALVVLLDLIMPGMNGLDVLAEIERDAALAARHVYILMTANNRALLATATPTLQALAVIVVRKPFDLDTILDTVARAAQRLPGA